MNKKTDAVFFYGVGALFLLGFFTLQGIAMFVPIPDKMLPILSGSQETMKAGVLLILGYFYGSSRGSFMKSEKAGEIRTGPANPNQTEQQKP